MIGISLDALVLFFVRVAAGGLAEDADQYGYGDDHNDYENEQRDYGDRHEIHLPARLLRPPGLHLYTTLLFPISRWSAARCLGLRPAQLSALDDPGEVLQVLL
jgi:hypothetical protein